MSGKNLWFWGRWLFCCDNELFALRTRQQARNEVKHRKLNYPGSRVIDLGQPDKDRLAKKLCPYALRVAV